MSAEITINIAYIASAMLFVIGLKMLGSPASPTGEAVRLARARGGEQGEVSETRLDLHRRHSASPFAASPLP